MTTQTTGRTTTRTTGALPEPRTAGRVLFGLRIAVTSIAAAILATASLPRKLDLHDPAWPQAVAFGTLVALFVVQVGLLLSRREWGRLRPYALAATLAASVLSAWTLRTDFVNTPADWSFGTTPWLAVILLINQPLRHLLYFLGLHAVSMVARAVVLGPSDADFFLNLLAASVGTIGFPLAFGIAVTMLTGMADRAEAASVEAAGIRTAEAVANTVHERRNRRLAELDDTVEPLLRGLADGSLVPDDPAVQRRCTIEAARLRRLFAETDQVSDPLLHELRHSADVAERRGVMVEFDLVGTWQAPPLPVRRALTEAPLVALSAARSQARVSVIGTPEGLFVNVVSDGTELPAAELPEPARLSALGVRQQIVGMDGATWIEVRWNRA